MYVSETHLRVRYAEIDQMGFVYYGNYAAYYEVGRAEAIRALGFTYKELEDLGIIMPVVKLESTYLRSARYDDLITIRTTLRELPASSSIAFQSELFNEEGKLLNIGITTLVFYDPVAGNKTTMHPELAQRLKPFFTGE